MNTHAFDMPFHRRFIFWVSVMLAGFLLVLYIFLTYLSVNMSYTMDYAKDAVIAKEQTYQKYQRAYIEALQKYHISETLAEEGYTKISSPMFLSRTPSVAFTDQ